ncbi:MAG: ABC transporter substrate-binding protein [Alphaproteobacteria bacterium]|nr:ABC transporter substrate-binding protein [Alphaproteobacteria bacterium]MBV9693875.1 ABC transporter substrate-binding protein [Alphaproteobacteria bacterium]
MVQVVGRSYLHNMRLLHGWIVLCLASAVPAGASPAASPGRVVSTFLCTDEYVFRLLPRNHIAALSFEATDRHPVVSTIADVAKGIAAIRPSAEGVLSLRPDLVVMYRDTMTPLHAQLAAAGVRILDVPWATSLGDVRRITHWLGGTLGARARADALLAQMDRALAHARAVAPRPPVRTLIYEPNGYATSGPLVGELMSAAGLVDTAPQLRLTRADTLPLEAVIAKAPELLILNGNPNAANTRAALVQHHPALAALSGNSKVAWADLVPLLCPGPWSVEIAPILADLGRQARQR